MISRIEVIDVNIIIDLMIFVEGKMVVCILKL